MIREDLPCFSESEEGQDFSHGLGIGQEPTQTIDLGALFSSGAFDEAPHQLALQSTTLGKLLDALPLPTIIIDRTYLVVFCNESCEKLSPGYQDICGVHFTDLIPRPKDQTRSEALLEKAVAVLDRAFATRRSQRIEAIIQIGERKVWARLHLRLIKIGAERYVLALIEDCTLERQQQRIGQKQHQELKQARLELEGRFRERTAELERVNEKLRLEIKDRKHAEATLRASEEFYRQMFQRHQAAKLIIDPRSGAIVDANSASARFYGYETDSLKRMKIKDLMAAGTIEHFPAESLTIDERGTSFLAAHRLASGEVREVAIYSAPVTVGERTLHYAIVYDVTDHKRAERLLIQSERLKAVADMAGGVAHNFSNVLDIVRSEAQRALTHLGKGEAKQSEQSLGKVLNAAAVGAGTVRRLRDFTLSKRGDRHAAGHVFESSSAVLSAIEMTTHWWKNGPARTEGKISLQHVLDDGCFVKGIETEFSEVVVNLIKNAAEALSSGGRILIRNAILANSVVLEVEDDGPGIAENDISQAFEPFWTTKGERGTGMGLPSCLGIIRKMGGDISMTSVPGERTTVRVTLPLAEQKKPEIHPTPDQWEKGLRILVIDDEADIVHLITQRLSKRGADVKGASCGKDALEILRTTEIDVVLCDLGMDDMNGWEIAQAVNEQCEKQGKKRPPFILLTGWGAQIGEEDIQDSQCVDRVVGKPIVFETLQHEISELVAGNR